MNLQGAADAFVAGWGAIRRLNGPFAVEQRDRAAWMHDPTRRRVGELVGVDLAPARMVELFPQGERGAIAAIVSGDTDEPRRAFRALGWRLLRTEPMFVHRLRDLPPLDSRVARVRSPGEVARVAKASRMRPESMGAEDVDDAAMRLYEATLLGEHAGWVRSIRAGEDAWVSSLNVREPYRRQGLGSGLMAALLHDDARLGRRASVLLASHTGALLYPRLGYERIGTLMVLMPIKSLVA